MDKRIEIVIGRPSSGKTLLATHKCRCLTLNQQKALYHSLEIDSEMLTKIFALSKETKIIDSIPISWMDIRHSIITEKPDLCVIDYLQLLKGYNQYTLQEIVSDFNSLDNSHSRLLILSQCIKESCERIPKLQDIVGIDKKISTIDAQIISLCMMNF